jgi:hypothetical protein
MMENEEKFIGKSSCMDVYVASVCMSLKEIGIFSGKSTHKNQLSLKENQFFIVKCLGKSLEFPPNFFINLSPPQKAKKISSISIFLLFSHTFKYADFSDTLLFYFSSSLFASVFSFISHTFLNSSREKDGTLLSFLPSLITYSHIHPHMSPAPSSYSSSREVEKKNMQILISKREKRATVGVSASLIRPMSSSENERNFR